MKTDIYQIVADKLSRHPKDIIMVSRGDQVVCHHDYDNPYPVHKLNPTKARIIMSPQTFQLNAALSFQGGQFIWAQCPSCKKIFVRILHAEKAKSSNE